METTEARKARLKALRAEAEASGIVPSRDEDECVPRTAQPCGASDGIARAGHPPRSSSFAATCRTTRS